MIPILINKISINFFDMITFISNNVINDNNLYVLVKYIIINKIKNFLENISNGFTSHYLSQGDYLRLLFFQGLYLLPNYIMFYFIFMMLQFSKIFNFLPFR